MLSRFRTATPLALAATLLATLALAPLAGASFTLSRPGPLGAADDTAGQRASPCGGFDALDRSGGVTEWPVGGGAGSGVDVLLDTPDASAAWQLSAFLLNETDPARPEDPAVLHFLYTQRAGPFCVPAVGGVAAWAGLDAVLQIRQWTGNGSYFYAVSVFFPEEGGGRGGSPPPPIYPLFTRVHLPIHPSIRPRMYVVASWLLDRIGLAAAAAVLSRAEG